MTVVILWTTRVMIGMMIDLYLNSVFCNDFDKNPLKHCCPTPPNSNSNVRINSLTRAGGPFSKPKNSRKMKCKNVLPWALNTQSTINNVIVHDTTASKSSLFKSCNGAHRYHSPTSAEGSSV